MPTEELDEIDRGILQLLQGDARNRTPVDMAEHLPVSDGTVRNRIENLEERGIIEGYVPVLNYEAAGFPLKLVISCPSPIRSRAEMAQEARDLPHVISVREMLTAQDNIRVTAVATDIDDITQIDAQLVELGLTIEREALMRHEFVRPFNGFGPDVDEEV